MTINRNDDYDKLAKILYPSIEASGNVYYGQTRKLTMDEILGKNNLNFESHIESFNNGDSTYTSYFMWKLGPLYGSVKFDPNKGAIGSSVTWESFPETDRFEIINLYEDEPNYFLYNPEIYGYFGDALEVPYIFTHSLNLYGTVFAKYDIIIDESVASNEIINSGEYKTYSNDVHCEFCNLCLTNGCSPTDHDDYILGDRNFFVESKNGHHYLYIQICCNIVAAEFYELPIGNPFKITSKNATAEFYISMTGNPDPNYVYSFDGSNWTTLGIGELNKVNIPANSSIYIKGRCNTINSTNFIQFDNLNFNSRLYTSGDIKWLNYNLNDDTYAIRPYAFYRLFNSTGMEKTLVNAPNLSYFSLSDHCYDSLFSGCALLEYMPLLPAKELYANCYVSMFYGCSKIKKASTLPAKYIFEYSYATIFADMSNLNEVTCLATAVDGFSSTSFWLDGVSENGVLNVVDTELFAEGVDGKPSGWKFNVVNDEGSGLYVRNAEAHIESAHYKEKSPYLVISGSDSDINGRGGLDNEHLFSMLEVNPLYNGGVSFDTYNKDGSFNQEIWGYKSFNSPVMFRNGIYGECASLTTANVSGPGELIVYSNGEGTDVRDISTAFGSDFKVTPKVPSRFSPFNPRAYLEVLHVNSEAENTSDYRMCESQAGIYSHNKFNSSDHIKFINREVLNLDPAPIMGEYAAFITNASINTDVDPSVVRFTEYTAIASAGNAYIKLSGGTDRDGNEKALIHINATEVSPTVNVQCDLGNTDFRYNCIYTDSIIARDVQVQQLRGRIPSINRVNYGYSKQMIDLSTCVGSLLFIALRPCRNDLNNAYFPHASYVYPGDSFSYYLNWIDYISNSQANPSITNANFADTALNNLVKDMSFCKISNGSNGSMDGYIHFYNTITDTFPRFVTSNSAVTIQIISYANTLFAEDNECRALYVLAVVR